MTFEKITQAVSTEDFKMNRIVEAIEIVTEVDIQFNSAEFHLFTIFASMTEKTVNVREHIQASSDLFFTHICSFPHRFPFFYSWTQADLPTILWGSRCYLPSPFIGGYIP